jgi:glycosyltransferase involved in cell wall biosynthesis
LNDLGTLAALDGERAAAGEYFEQALAADPQCLAAERNLALLAQVAPAAADDDDAGGEPPIKVALVSFLFNWPSTGGGIMHTLELARFLGRAGYDVRLFCPRFAPWQIGRVGSNCPFPVDVLEFDEPSWNVAAIGDRFRAAVDRFAPDQVIITDCWNMKPHLAAALAGYPVNLRMQALECLCPLNNLRLLPADEGGFRQCPTHRLAAAADCRSCLVNRGHTSGGLHRAERELAGAGRPEYDRLLRRALAEAEAVLVLNPLVAEMYRPYCRRVEVVTWGMDASRFAWPPPVETNDTENSNGEGLTRILFAGLPQEAIKGFRVLHEACARLWRRRQDFELLVTGDPAGRSDPFTRRIGWQSQAALPSWYRKSDITAVPTIAQDGLSRTSVEAMASGRPVVASRIGGLPYTVADTVTGLLCRPGDAADWAEKLERLLDDAGLREELGRAGRRVFEERFTWERVIEQQYRPLLVGRRAAIRQDRTTVKVPQQTVAPASAVANAGGSAVDSLRILFLANYSGVWNNPAGVADALEGLGHRVTRRHEFAVPGPEALLDELGSGRFDCLLFSKGRLGAVELPDILQPDGEAIAAVLRGSPVPAYMWYVDRVIGFDPARETWMRKVAPLARVAFITDGQLAQKDWADFRILRQGILQSTVREADVPEAEQRDVAFIGAIYGERAAELAPVRRRFPLEQITDVFGPDLAAVIPRYRIILGPRFPSVPDYWSDRIYVVLGHGGFFLAPEVPGMCAEGFKPGRHYAPLSDDPAADVAYWLERPDERRRIARAGRELVLGHFTYQQRLAELCRVIRETLT